MALTIGWSEVEITPTGLPVLVAGQFYARVSEGVADPLVATVCAVDSGEDCVVFVACDLVSIPPHLQSRTQERLTCGVPPEKLVFNATHTHTGPEVQSDSCLLGNIAWGGSGVDLGVHTPDETIEWISGRLAEAVDSAWRDRQPASIDYGMDYAVLGRNRRWVDAQGTATMYGLNKSTGEHFRHFEGYEDHSLNLLATYDAAGLLTGIIVNIPCPSQEEGGAYLLGADFWFEARAELRARFGAHLRILPQCSAAGELTSWVMYEKAAHVRMLRLRGRSSREEIAVRIADSVGRILPYLKQRRSEEAVLVHRTLMLDVPCFALTQAHADAARQEANHLREVYEEELAKLERDPVLRQQPRWYVDATKAFRRMSWHLGVVARFEHQKANRTQPVEIHVLRLGEVAFATTPVEYYLDFGIQIKVRSPATQTFLVQLVGDGGYLPSPRAVEGGGYGAVPPSNPLGPEAGQLIADRTVEALRDLFPVLVAD